MVFPCPTGDFKESNPSPTNGFFTNDESRVTKHGFYAFHETRDTAFMAARTVAPADKSLLLCPELPGIARNCSVKKCPAPVSVPRQPFWVGFTTSPARRSSRRPLGSLRCGQHRMNPCRERGTFDIAMTHFYRALTDQETTLTPAGRFGILAVHGGLVQATGLLYRPGFGHQGRRDLLHVSNLPSGYRWG